MGKAQSKISSCDTGMEVVRWIITNKPSIKHVVVHTCNTSAGPEMIKKLSENGYSVIKAPFVSLDFDKLEKGLLDLIK